MPLPSRIILIELWYWTSIEELQISQEKDLRAQGFDDSIVKSLTANRLVDSTSDSIYDDAGTSYGDAVRRCIKGLDHKETNLVVDGFKDEVYLKIFNRKIPTQIAMTTEFLITFPYITAPQKP
ncbi:hypothetical protein BDD12DRAFT_893070 [Trichophaea hybrida]|nr:hypothetical protein BDD12DRAFT_893070 [Trichophaea hybrida]